MSLKALGSSASSAFSSLYHFLHYKASLSIYDIRLPNTLTFSSPFTAAQQDSLINFNDST